MSELLKCFTFLAENAPAWIKSLEELEDKVKQRQAEVEKMGRTPPQTLRKRSGSNESLRPSRDDTGNSSSVGEQRTPIFSPDAIASTPVLDRAPSNASKRKRIASSIASITSATQKRYRIRNPIIVYYDSEVQKGFEHLVHSIGSGRNHIRKARLAMRMETLTSVSATARVDQAIRASTLPSSSASMSKTMTARNNTPSGYELLLAQGLRSSRGLETLRPSLAFCADGLGSTSASTPDSCTLADQALDKAQAFCETGAYHFLREGECAEEVLGTRRLFEELVESAGKEVERLTVLERARQNQREKERVVELERQELVKKEVGSNLALIGHETFNATIEADDESDDEDEDYAALMPPYRSMARI
ncbi:hypothetical protein E6O75_ATG03949 [Venturia nashicola]|uniref:Uncharacterized protein n=1 Tax=Venturia nashicola TaxID=86259 RepID=A0A4Z1PK94_9PEZI|nr:hypothetical protein E6O75_ATG03949 [Venturia nashicola]